MHHSITDFELTPSYPNPPFLARNNSYSLLVPRGKDSLCLPPLVVTGVGHMQDVSVHKRKTLTGQATVFRGVIVKQGSVTQIDLLKFFFKHIFWQGEGDSLRHQYYMHVGGIDKISK